jgi:hypothetical protein
MAVVGYARVSTEDQSTEGQILDLRKFGCTEMFRENASSADRERPQLKAARSLAHLLDVMETLERKGVVIFRQIGEGSD